MTDDSYETVRDQILTGLRDGATLDFADMTAYLAGQSMARQYIPERLEIVAELPRTPRGKIQKFRLREIAKSATD